MSVLEGLADLKYLVEAGNNLCGGACSYSSATGNSATRQGMAGQRLTSRLIDAGANKRVPTPVSESATSLLASKKFLWIQHAELQTLQRCSPPSTPPPK